MCNVSQNSNYKGLGNIPTHTAQQEEYQTCKQEVANLSPRQPHILCGKIMRQPMLLVKKLRVTCKRMARLRLKPPLNSIQILKFTYLKQVKYKL